MSGRTRECQRLPPTREEYLGLCVVPLGRVFKDGIEDGYGLCRSLQKPACIGSIDNTIEADEAGFSDLVGIEMPRFQGCDRRTFL